MSLTHSSPSCSKRFSIQASLCSSSESLPLSALMDSRAEDNFIDEEVAHQAGFPMEPLRSPSLSEPWMANSSPMSLTKLLHFS